MDALYRRGGVDEAYRATGRMYYSVESAREAPGRGQGGRAACTSRRRLLASTTSACMSFIACIAAAMTHWSPPASRCTCTSTHRAPRPRRGWRHRAPSSMPSAGHARLPRPRKPAGATSDQQPSVARPLTRAMPKIVDHAERRDEIAHVACQVSRPWLRAGHGGAHRARRRLHHRHGGALLSSPSRTSFSPRCADPARIEQRSPVSATSGEANLLACCPNRCRSMRSASPNAPSGWPSGGRCPPTRSSSASTPGCTASTCACSSAASPSTGRSGAWPPTVRDQVLRSVVTFING
jgi:hypothetical protein